MNTKQTPIPHEWELLKRDFDSCQLPNPYDPKTEKTLRDVAINIYNGKYSLQDFYNFTETSLYNGSFADACKEFVTNLLAEDK